MLAMTHDLEALLALPLPERLAAAEAAWDAAPPDAEAHGLDEAAVTGLRQAWLAFLTAPDRTDELTDTLERLARNL